MKIYYLNNTMATKEEKDFSSFSGLVSIDIGYRTCGITIVNNKKVFKTINWIPVQDNIKLNLLSIPDYISLSKKVCSKLLNVINANTSLCNYAWSMEIPNIVGSYAPALCILLTSLTNTLLQQGIHTIFFTGNRLGGFYLKKRSYTKTAIKNFVKEHFAIINKITDHEADSILQAYSICKGVYHFSLGGVSLREFDLTLEDITHIEKRF
jgi:hypothetical protein